MTTSSMLGLLPSIECIVQPISGQARLTRNCSKLPLKISDGPRFHLDVQLEEIPIVLSDQQYALLVSLFNAFQLRKLASKFQRWRSESVGAKSRWKFALDVTLEKIQERNIRHSLKFAQRRAQQNVVYVQGYTRHLTEVRNFEIKFGKGREEVEEGRRKGEDKIL